MSGSSDLKQEPELTGHMLGAHDPANPHNWAVAKKIYVCAAATFAAFVVAFGATIYTAGITGVMEEYSISMTEAVLGMSLYLFGIAFAPIITPHLSEKFGRTRVYQSSLPLLGCYLLGSGLSTSCTGLMICRFFAGFAGGPCLVLIEGTFADVWGEHVTVTYYAVLSLASFVGAAAGPLVGGFVFAAKGWRYTQWTSLLAALLAALFTSGMPETYARAIVRTRHQYNNIPSPLMPALSGTTLAQMTRVTIIDPIIMLVSEPLVLLISLYLGYNFAVVFSFFISIPVVLSMTYSFTISQVGLAFIAAIIGALLAAAIAITLDRLTTPKILRNAHQAAMPVQIEHRLYSAMLGAFLIPASLFWIAWTASPTTAWPVPVIGTAVYVTGNLLVLISFISYLFDAYPAKGTLSALTAAAVVRIVLAGFLPLVIIQMIMGLTGAWAVSLLGFVGVAMIPVPFVLFRWGPGMRGRSRFAACEMGMGHGGV
ncbi:MAG: hypothetical protein M1817_001041 [Caeruleum heppii]|nr:MAG: hypothetical protein M1817_001041 [Caeruleum heppii]